MKTSIKTIMKTSIVCMFAWIGLAACAAEEDFDQPATVAEDDEEPRSGTVCCEDVLSQSSCEGSAECVWDDKESQCLSVCPGLSGPQNQAACTASPFCTFIGGQDDVCRRNNDSFCNGNDK